MKKLHISEDLSLPLDTVTSTIGVLGGKGMGKTNFGSVLVEELSKAGMHWSYLDPLGVVWGLRHSADGKGPGVEAVILGGVHGDIPIEPTGGTVVADFVVDEPVNVIVDFSRKIGGETWSKGEKIKFVTEYAERLFKRQGDLLNGRRREPIFQILDEAARYIPQLIPHGATELARCVGAWETLTEEGRNVGIGVCFLTQRSGRINKSVLELVDALFSFRLVGPNSVEAVMNWMGEHVPKEQIHKHIEILRSLDRGRALAISPGWLKFEGVIGIRARETFDSSATPKPGERQQRATGRAAKPDLAKYVERMKETIERAEANDPAKLKARIRELEKNFKSIKVDTPTSTKDGTEIDQRAVDRAVERAVDKVRAEFKKGINLREHIISTTKKGLERILLGIPVFEGMNVETPPTKIDTRTVLLPVDRTAPPQTKIKYDGPLQLGGPHKRILKALAELRSIGKDQPPTEMIAAWAGYRHGGGGFNNPIGNLRTWGLVDGTSLTEEGLKISGIMPTPDQEEVHRRIRNILDGPERKILDVLLQLHGESISKEELAEKSGYTFGGGGFNNPLGRLRTAGFVEYSGQGAKACDWLFTE